MTNMRKAKAIVDDVTLVLRDLDSANSRILAGALENASRLLETDIIMSETKRREYFEEDEENYIDEDFLNELKGM